MWVKNKWGAGRRGDRRTRGARSWINGGVRLATVQSCWGWSAMSCIMVRQV